MTSLELREKRAKKWEAAKAFLDTKRGENGVLSKEDDATYQQMEDEIIALGKEVERLERQEALDKELSMPINKPILSSPDNSKVDVKTGRASDEYKSNFWNVMRSKVPNAAVLNALEEGTDSEGGYLVPDEYEKTLVEALEEQNIFRGLAKVIQTTSGDRNIPMVVEKGEAYWVAEGQAYTESDITFDQVQIGAHKIGTMIKVSDELLQDSVFDLPSYIAKEFARRIGAEEENAFINGDGSGKPLGILAARGGAEIGLQLQGTEIKADDLITLFHSLKGPYRKNAVWIMNDSTVCEIRKLKNADGTYIWQPGITANSPDTILGRPVYTTTAMPEIADGNKSIAFGDFGFYWIADRQGRSFKKLSELYATTGQVGFLGSQRVDGRLVLTEAVKVLEHQGKLKK